MHIKGPKDVLGTHSLKSNCHIPVTVMSKVLWGSTEIQAEPKKQIPRLPNNQAAQLVTKPEITVSTLQSSGYKQEWDAKAPSLIRRCYRSNILASSGGNWPSKGTVHWLLSVSSPLSMAYWRCAGMCVRQAKSWEQDSVGRETRSLLGPRKEGWAHTDGDLTWASSAGPVSVGLVPSLEPSTWKIRHAEDSEIECITGR